jgi:hypothetical protein
VASSSPITYFRTGKRPTFCPTANAENPLTICFFLCKLSRRGASGAPFGIGTGTQSNREILVDVPAGLTYFADFGEIPSRITVVKRPRHEKNSLQRRRGGIYGDDGNRCAFARAGTGHQRYAAGFRHGCGPGLAGFGRDAGLCQGSSRRRNVPRFAERQGQRVVGSARRTLPAIPSRQARWLERRLGDQPAVLQMMAQLNGLRILIAAAAVLVSTAAAPVLAQTGREPFLRRDLPGTAWYYDGRDDVRDFPNNGFFPGDFAAKPADALIGAAGLFGSTPVGGRQFGPIYCARRYRPHSPAPGFFQGHDGTWYRCR